MGERRNGVSENESYQAGIVRELSATCPVCCLPQRHMRAWISTCDNGHKWDRAIDAEAATRDKGADHA